MDRDQLLEHLRFAQALGVDGMSRDPVWRSRRSEPAPASIPSPVTQPVTLSSNAEEALAAVRADLGDCTRCKLHAQGRTQIVFGVGTPEAKLMFVGEAPGHDED